jgi:hypothetical protein
MEGILVTGKNEGEGNRAAAQQYNEQTRQFVEEGNVEAKAAEAAKALDSDEARELEEAERKGKDKALEEDPQVRRDR